MSAGVRMTPTPTMTSCRPGTPSTTPTPRRGSPRATPTTPPRCPNYRNAQGKLTANAVVLAKGDAFRDALAGIPLATAKQGPLLVTPGTSLDPGVLGEIQRVLAPGKTVYVLGGVKALTPTVDA